MAVNFAPIFNGWQGFTPSGIPLSGGLVWTYLAGTSTPAASYTTNVGNIANSNPIQLDAGGRPPAEIWLTAGQNYKFVLMDSLSNTLATYDNILGIVNAPSSLWVASGVTPTFISATQFSVPGNLVTTFQVGLRIQYTLTATQFYGTITASSFRAGITTVTVLTDSTPLNSNLNAVNLSQITPDNTPMPTLFENAITFQKAATFQQGVSITGNETVSGSLTVGAGAVVTGSVSATTGIIVGNVASGSATTLDWYEETSTQMGIAGSTVAGTASYGGRTMRGTRIGQLFYFDLFLDWSTFTGTGFILITGTFPFTVASSLPTAITVISENLTYANSLIGIVTNSAGGTIQISTASSGGTFALVPVDAAATLYISGCVRVA
jgi:hypothetical protein